MTCEPKVRELDEYWGKLESQLRPFSPADQRVAVAVYRELAKGKAVDADQLGRVLGISAAESQALLQSDSTK
jgi:hypothetical protein